MGYFMNKYIYDVNSECKLTDYRLFQTRRILLMSGQKTRKEKGGRNLLDKRKGMQMLFISCRSD